MQVSPPLSATSLRNQIPLFQIILDFFISTKLKFKLKSAADSPEPIRSAMMFGTDRIGPSLTGFDPGSGHYIDGLTDAQNLRSLPP